MKNNANMANNTEKNANCEPELITGRELARRLGVSETAVRKAVKAGRIRPSKINAKGNNLFIENVARAEWNRNTMPEKSTGRKVAGAPPSPLADVGESLSLPVLSAHEVRAVVGQQQARILAVKADVAEKKVVDIEAVAKIWERQVEKAKRLFLALPVELRMLFPSMTNDDMSLVENRIVAILNDLAAWDPREGTI